MNVNFHKVRKNSLVVFSIDPAKGSEYLENAKHLFEKALEKCEGPTPMIFMAGETGQQDQIDILEFEFMTEEEIEELVKNYKDNANLFI